MRSRPIEAPTERKRVLMAFDFICISCKWEGTQPTLDAHANPFCPRCGRPAEFAEIVRMRAQHAGERRRDR